MTVEAIKATGISRSVAVGGFTKDSLTDFVKEVVVVGKEVVLLAACLTPNLVYAIWKTSAGALLIYGLLYSSVPNIAGALVSITTEGVLHTIKRESVHDLFNQSTS